MRTRKPDLGAGHFFDAIGPGHFDSLDGQQPAQLGLVDLAIATGQMMPRSS